MASVPHTAIGGVGHRTDTARKHRSKRVRLMNLPDSANETSTFLIGNIHSVFWNCVRRGMSHSRAYSIEVGFAFFSS
jgi:hypothetical protein